MIALELQQHTYDGAMSIMRLRCERAARVCKAASPKRRKLQRKDLHTEQLPTSDQQRMLEAIVADEYFAATWQLKRQVQRPLKQLCISCLSKALYLHMTSERAHVGWTPREGGVEGRLGGWVTYPVRFVQQAHEDASLARPNISAMLGTLWGTCLGEVGHELHIAGLGAAQGQLLLAAALGQAGQIVPEALVHPSLACTHTKV